MSSAAAPKSQPPSRQPELRAQQRAAHVLEVAEATLAPPPSGTNAMHGEPQQTLPKASPPSGANATPGEPQQTLPKASTPGAPQQTLSEAPPPKAPQARRPQPQVDGFGSPTGRPASDGGSVSPGTSVSDGGSVSPDAEAGFIETIKAMVSSGDAFSTLQNINHTISALTHVKTGLAKRKMEVGHDARVDQKKAKCIEKTNIAIEHENKQLADLREHRGCLMGGRNTSMKAKQLTQVNHEITNHEGKVAKLEAERARHTASSASS